MITGEQAKAARKLLGWTVVDLASRSGVGQTTLLRFELGTRTLEERYVAQVRRALERGGVEFSDSEPPRLKADRTRPAWDAPPGNPDE